MTRTPLYLAIGSLIGLFFGLCIASLWLLSPTAAELPTHMREKGLAPEPGEGANLLPEAAERATKDAGLVADEPVFDFGEVVSRESISHAFVLRNVSDLPLAIKDARSSCSCTVADWSAETIAPGEITELTAILDLSDASGQIHRTIIVETDDPQAPSAELFIVGTIVAD
jgi:hypothetical protein